MALILTQSEVPVSARKTIVAKASVTGAVVYAVPDGKTFEGAIITYGSIDFNINGVDVFSMGTTAAGIYTKIPLKLHGADVLKCGPSYSGWALLGTEA